MKRFRYSFHNIVGHPMMEVFNLLGMKSLAKKIHDMTLPNDTKEQ